MPPVIIADSAMKLLDTESPAGRAIELVGDLVKQGRMSNAEARVIEELVWHPEFPAALRSKTIVPGHPPGTDTVKRQDQWDLGRYHSLPKDFDGRQSPHATRIVDVETGSDLGSAD